MVLWSNIDLYFCAWKAKTPVNAFTIEAASIILTKDCQFKSFLEVILRSKFNPIGLFLRCARMGQIETKLRVSVPSKYLEFALENTQLKPESVQVIWSFWRNDSRWDRENDFYSKYQQQWPYKLKYLDTKAIYYSTYI